MKNHFILKQNEKKTIVIDKSGDYVIELAGDGAEANIVGAFVGKNDEEFTVHTLQHHKAPNTLSDLLIKTVMSGRAKFTYDGLIKVEKNAQKSNAYQRNENLLLSDKVHVESKPELEIEANDVRCTHGATMGMIDEEEIFYLMSRGIKRRDAEELIISGFFQKVFDRIENVPTRQKLEKQIM